MNFSKSLIAALLLSASCPVGFAQTILNSSPSARPGDAISLQGDFSAMATVFLASGTSSTLNALPVVVQSAGHAIVEIPSTEALNLYKVCVKNPGANPPGPLVYVNRAVGMHFDSPEITPGGVLRIFGRNLVLKGGATQVRFVAQGGGPGGGNAVIDLQKSDAYKLQLTAPPSLVPGITYDVFVTNGFGGAEGETKMPLSVLAIAAGVDHFNLGVPWAVKFTFHGNVYNVKTDPRLSLKAVGDGVTNDLAALQAAIDRANQDGGGVVYLPAGNYRCELPQGMTGGISMRNRVVMQGAGRDVTAINYGYGMGAPGWSSNGRWGLLWDNTVLAGVADLSINNVDDTGAYSNNMTGKGTELFFQRIRYNLNKGDWLWWGDSNKVVISDSIFTQGVTSQAHYHGPLQLGGCRNFVVARNHFTFAVWGLNLPNTNGGVFEENIVHRDGAARWPVELNIVNHVLILDFAQNIAVLNNTFAVINGPSQNINDGETIIAEGGGPNHIDEDSGTVTAATPTTLQDNTKSWGTMQKKPVVAIVHGTGRGQWRSISSRSGNTLTLDRPWDVTPVAGSRYSIFNWGSHNWLLQGNHLEGNQRGITIYHNATNQVAIVGNTLKNSGSIDLTPIQVQEGGEPMRLVPTFDTQIVGNSVSDENGAMGVFIGIHPIQHVVGNTFGTSVIGLEVRNNSITAHIPNTPAVVDATFPNGYLNYLEWHPGSFVDEGIPAVLGSIFEDNLAINCNKALYLSTAVHNTYVSNLALTNTPQMIDDAQYQNAAAASVRTVVQAAAPTTYASWKLSKFTGGAENNPAISGAAADPDKDGINNLLEYFFDADPSKPSLLSQYAAFQVTQDGLSLTYEKNTAKADLTCTPKLSTDFPTWAPANAADTVATPGMIQIHTTTIPSNQARGFLKLEIAGP